MNDKDEVTKERLLEEVEELEDADYQSQAKVVINYVVDLSRREMEKKKANVFQPATQGLWPSVRCDTHFLSGTKSGCGYLEMEGRDLEQIASAANKYLRKMEVEGYRLVELSEKFRDDENQFAAFKDFLDDGAD